MIVFNLAARILYDYLDRDRSGYFDGRIDTLLNGLTNWFLVLLDRVGDRPCRRSSAPRSSTSSW